MLISTVRYCSNLIDAVDDAFGPEQTDGKVEVVTWRAHRHTDALGIDANLERLLNNDIILQNAGGVALIAQDFG